MEQRPYRNIFVCYDGFRQAGWRTEDELQKLLETETVNYYQKGNQITYVDKHIGSNILVGQDYKEISRDGNADSTKTTKTLPKD